MKKVLVIGDVIADVYRDCTFKKMCPDAPAVPAVVVAGHDLRPGGAANVAVNLAALAPDARITLIGEMDTSLARSIKQLSKNRVDMSLCAFTDSVWTKERISVDGKFVARIDNKWSTDSLTAEQIEYSLKEYLNDNEPDLIVMSDYAGGAINKFSLEVLLDMREKLLVDTKMTDLSVFGSSGRRTRTIKLNHDEWTAVTSTESEPEKFFQTLIVTDGPYGAYLQTRSQLTETKSVTHTVRTRGHSVATIDVCGCGDTFLAGLAASLLKNDDDFTAMQFANAAAATVVTKSRTSVADLGLVLELLGREGNE